MHFQSYKRLLLTHYTYDKIFLVNQEKEGPSKAKQRFFIDKHSSGILNNNNNNNNNKCNHSITTSKCAKSTKQEARFRCASNR
jgi:hypothetical protein